MSSRSNIFLINSFDQDFAMGSCTSNLKPHELVEHRKLNTALENVEIPARAESRSLTDKKGFVIFGVAILVLFPFLIYTLVKSDLRHLTHHTDTCGNFCGEKNEKIDGVHCSGIDYTNKPYGDGIQCLRTCDNRNPETCSKSWTEIYDELQNDEDFQQFDEESEEIHQQIYANLQWWKFVLSIIATIGLGILTLVLLRYMPAVVVWFIIFFTLAVVALMIVGVWIIYFVAQGEEYTKKDTTPLLTVAVIWTIIAIIIFTVFIVLFKKIGLVIQLYKEAMKALAAMPLLVLVPIVTSIIQIVIIIIAFFTTTAMISSRELFKITDDFYVYDASGVAIFTIVFNIVVVVWTMRFFHGIQYMISSGSVTTWYFARNKDYLGSPIYSNVKIVMRYHIGTIAFGSFLMTLFSVVKAVLRSICRNACCRCLFVMWCSSVEVILKFLSENAYIQTAMHGQSFLRSAKRATRLLMANISSVIAINCVGDFVLAVIILILSILSTGISYAIFMSQTIYPAVFPSVICFVMNLVIISIIFGTLNAIIDTLFICFCEDSLLNDGLSKPYYMSRGLMEFVENSKKLYGK